MAAATYRRTKDGEWVVYAPAGALTEGAEVAVSKRDGSTKIERIARVSRPFTVEGGTSMVYGYLDYLDRRPYRDRSWVCEACGEGWASVTVRDGSGIPGRVCRVCARDARDGGVSFA